MIVNPVPGPVHAIEGYGLAEAPADGSALAWPTVVDWLTHSRSYWVTTVRADGRPHAMPVWGLWIDGGLWFSTDPASVKGRNLARSPDVVVHLESGDEVCILEGAVRRVTPEELPGSFVADYAAKYDTELDVTAPGFGFYALTPTVALTWTEVDFLHTATRWAFGA